MVYSIRNFLLKNIRKLKILFLTSFCFLSLGWGSVGHKIINRNTTLSFPPELNFLMHWADPLADHGSDADNRKGSDPNEAPKHYIDIDNYPEFAANGIITQNLDSVVMKYGYTFVIDQGILPWAIMQAVDSLQTAFQRGDWARALLVASDLGHYVGDAYMPLHITKNYNGQYTGQLGVHSRYESTMIGNYSQEIVFTGDTAFYISNVSDFTFEMIYANYHYVDSVLSADLIAKHYAGGSYNSTYYQKLWELTKNFTTKLFKNASYDLALLIYTAWKNAGEPVITNIENEKIAVTDFKLEQNYPNPFNPATTIRWQSMTDGWQTLKVYDVLGNEVVTLVNEYKPAGSYEVDFNASNLSTGIYFYSIQVDDINFTRKMVLIR